MKRDAESDRRPSPLTQGRSPLLCALLSAPLLCLSASLVTTPRSAEARPSQKLAELAEDAERLAVLEFKSFGVLKPLELMRLSDLTRREVKRSLGDQVQVISRANISVLLEDPSVQAACAEGCEVKVGRAVQAHLVMTGLVFQTEGELSATLKLLRVKDQSLVGVEEATGRDLKALEESLKGATRRLSMRLFKGGDGGEALTEGIKLNLNPLAELKELNPISRFGLPTPLLVQYDQALKVDEDDDASLDEKVEVWAQLAGYNEHPQLARQARGRLAYWQARVQRRAACDQTWEELSPVMSLSHVVSKEERRALALDFLESCGRDEQQNPHVRHPALRRVLREEREAKEAQELAEAKAQARAEEQRGELSPLEVWLGVSHGVKAEGLSYHARLRLQPEWAWERALFLDMSAAVVSTPASLNDIDDSLWDAELSGALGLQWLNSTKWSPTFSLGYARSRGASFGVGELGLRYLYAPGWLNFALTAQYLKGFSLEETQAELNRSAQPTGPLDPVRGYIPRLDRLNGEVRLTLWVDTGFKGMLLGGLVLFLVANMEASR